MVTEEQRKKLREFKEIVDPTTPFTPFLPKSAISKITDVSKGPAPKPSSTTPQVFTDPTTGKPSGVTVGGKTFLGLQGSDIKTILEGEGTTARDVQTRQVGEKAIKEIGQVPELTPEQLAAELDKLNIPANLKESIAGILAETATGAAAGAGVGAAAGIFGGPAAPVTVPVAAGIGAVTGGTAALLRSVQKNLQAEAKEDADAADATFKGARKSQKLIVSEVNQGRIEPSEAVRLYNIEQAKIDRAERQIKELTSTNLKDYLSDGSTKYAKILEFNSAGGEAEVLRLSLEGAILQPDPTKVYIPDVEDTV